MVMPQEGGPELAQRLRVTHPDVKVLFTSGYTEGVNFRLDALPHNSHFLQKPYMPDVLVNRVREILDQR